MVARARTSVGTQPGVRIRDENPAEYRNIDRDVLIWALLAWHHGGRNRARTIAHEQKNDDETTPLSRSRKRGGTLPTKVTSWIEASADRDPNQKLQHSRLEEVIKHDSE